MAATDPYIIAVATDEPARLQIDLPVLDLNNPPNIADFICRHLALAQFALNEPVRFSHVNQLSTDRTSID